MLSADSSYVGLGAVGVAAKACEVGAGGVRSAGIAVMDPVHDRFAPHSFGTVGVDMEAFVGDKPLLALDLPAVSACAVSRALMPGGDRVGALLDGTSARRTKYRPTKSPR